MKGASIACQSSGKPGGRAGEFSGRTRFASEYSFVSFVDSLPVCGSIRRILIPPQKLPKLIPHAAIRIDHNVRVDRIEVIFLTRTKNQALVRPLVIRAARIQGLVCHQGYAGSVLSEYGKCIVKVILPIEVGFVWRPKVLRFRTLLLNPLGYTLKDEAATPPVQ